MRRGRSSAICARRPGHGSPPAHGARVDDPRRVLAEAPQLEVGGDHGRAESRARRRPSTIGGRGSILEVQAARRAADDLRWWQTRGPHAARERSRVVPLGLAVGPRRTSAYLAITPGSARSVTALNDLGQTVVPLLIAAPLAAALGGPSQHRAAAHLLVAARRRLRSPGASARPCGPGSRSCSTSRCRTRAGPTSATSAACPCCWRASSSSPSDSLRRRRPGPGRRRRPDHHQRAAVRQLRHLPRHGVRDERGPLHRAGHRGHLPGRGRGDGVGGARRPGPSLAPPRGSAADRRRRPRVAGRGRQRLRLHDRGRAPTAPTRSPTSAGRSGSP